MGAYFGVGSGSVELDEEEELEGSTLEELEGSTLEELEGSVEDEGVVLLEEGSTLLDEGSEELGSGAGVLLEDGAAQDARKRSSAGIRGRNSFIAMLQWVS